MSNTRGRTPTDDEHAGSATIPTNKNEGTHYKYRSILGTSDNTTCGDTKTPLSYLNERLQKYSKTKVVQQIQIETSRQGPPHDPRFVSTITLTNDLARDLVHPRATHSLELLYFTSSDAAVETFYNEMGVSKKQDGGFRKKGDSKHTAAMSLVIQLEKFDKDARCVWIKLAKSLKDYKACRKNSIQLGGIEYKACERGDSIQITASDQGKEAITKLFHLCSMIGLCIQIEGQSNKKMVVSKPTGLFKCLSNWTNISTLHDTLGPRGQGYTTKTHPRFEYLNHLSPQGGNEHVDEKDSMISKSLGYLVQLPFHKLLGDDHEISQVRSVEDLKECHDALHDCVEVCFDLEWGDRWTSGESYENQSMIAFIQLVGYKGGNGTNTFIVHLLNVDVRSNFRNAIGIPIFSNGKIVKTGHSTAVGDLPLLMNDLGVIVHNLFDTQEAHKEFMKNKNEHRQPIGLVPLLRKYDIIGQSVEDNFAKLKKQYQDSDWTNVPGEGGDPRRLSYLEMDVRYLAQLRSSMMASLDEEVEEVKMSMLRSILEKTLDITRKVQSSLADDARKGAGQQMTNMYRDFATDTYDVGYVWNDIAEDHYKNLIQCRYLVAKKEGKCLSEVAPTNLLVCLSMHAAANANEVRQCSYFGHADDSVEYLKELVEALRS